MLGLQVGARRFNYFLYHRQLSHDTSNHQWCQLTDSQLARSRLHFDAVPVNELGVVAVEGLLQVLHRVSARACRRRSQLVVPRVSLDGLTGGLVEALDRFELTEAAQNLIIQLL